MQRSTAIALATLSLSTLVGGCAVQAGATLAAHRRGTAPGAPLSVRVQTMRDAGPYVAVGTTVGAAQILHADGRAESTSGVELRQWSLAAGYALREGVLGLSRLGFEAGLLMRYGQPLGETLREPALAHALELAFPIRVFGDEDRQESFALALLGADVVITTQVGWVTGSRHADHELFVFAQFGLAIRLSVGTDLIADRR